MAPFDFKMLVKPEIVGGSFFWGDVLRQMLSGLRLEPVLSY